MFLGHYAVGLGTKRFAPRTSLGTLLAAALFLDLLWPLFLLTGVERVRIDPGNTPVTPLAFDSYPWSHSLALSLVWSALLGGAYWGATRYRPGAVAVACLTLSHWILDFASHRPDLPIWPGGPKAGLGLWHSVSGTVAVEIGMLAAGTWMYLRATRAKDRIGSIGLVVFLGVHLALYAASLLGPPPPSVTAIAVTTLLLVPILLAAAWIDRHRERA